jgi:hypothetical protein
MEGNMIHDKESIPRALHQVGTANSLPERVDLNGRLFAFQPKSSSLAPIPIGSIL